MPDINSNKPQHIFLIVADSLRYDSVYSQEGLGIPYIEGHSTQFNNASSAACWTLPATASLFTGELPHEHRATTQTRALKQDAVTMAQILKKQGYATYQITSNVATTEIFGLEKGFDKVIKTWELAEQKGLKISQLLVLLGKRRIRKKLFSTNAINDSLSSDIKAGSVWFRSFYQIIFDHAKSLIESHEKKNEKVFLFINLMETHFPYHIDTEFKFSNSNFFGKLSEIKTLYNIVNQTFLTKENSLPDSNQLSMIKSRQRKSWELVRNHLDEFVRFLHEGKDNLVVFTSDHGENFGDQDWVYHFSNVTDACTRVPIFWLDNDSHDPMTISHRTSSRLLFHSIVKKAGYTELNGHDLFANNIFNIPISQSYWYNNQGKTLEKYKFNQFCFHYDGMRYLKKNGHWSVAKSTEYNSGIAEESFQLMGSDTNPVEELINDLEVKKYINEQLQAYLKFESSIKK